MKIGFIGLGNMGAPMAANLAKAGHSVTGFDMAEVAVEGVRLAGRAAEAAEGQDVVITMLPNGAILRAVAQEVLPAMRGGAALVDCSTVDVESARAVAAEAEAAGLLFVDAPVSGGVGGALVQLAKRRGARVIALASESKHTEVAELGPDRILPRAPANLRDALGGDESRTVEAQLLQLWTAARKSQRARIADEPATTKVEPLQVLAMAADAIGVDGLVRDASTAGHAQRFQLRAVVRHRLQHLVRHGHRHVLQVQVRHARHHAREAFQVWSTQLRAASEAQAL